MNSTKHVRFLKRFLGVIPESHEDLDSNVMALMYFCVTGISLVQDIENSRDYVDYIYKHLKDQGFRGSLIYKLEDDRYDPPNLSATYFALSMLMTLKEDISKTIDRKAVMEYVVACQADDGSFRPFLDSEGVPFGDSDVRYCLVATSIRKMLYDGSPPVDIDIDKLERYIMSTISYDGALGGSFLGESHAGFTFCGLTALSLTDRLKGKTWDKTIEWLIHRQISSPEDFGGFNGRLNKTGDSCYCFWVGASLKLLGVEFDALAVKQFLLKKCQNTIVGGFAKTAEESQPDPYHTFLSMATLSMLEGKLNSELVMSEEAVDFMKQLEWN